MDGRRREKENNLRKEFSKLDKFPASPLPSFDALVVMCGEEIEVKGENGQRIKSGLNVIKKIRPGSPLIFMGTVYHIKHLKDYLAEQKIVRQILYPTKRKHESSWTQIKSLQEYLSKRPVANVLILSHTYHIPRVRRYCVKYMTGQKYDFYPVDDIKKYSKQIENEIEKIIKYAEKGDLPLDI